MSYYDTAVRAVLNTHPRAIFVTLGVVAALPLPCLSIGAHIDLVPFIPGVGSFD